MQVTINQSEIEQAIKGYIVQQGICTSGKDVTISLTAGRKENGTTATIDILDANTKQTAIEDLVSPICNCPTEELSVEPDPVVEESIPWDKTEAVEPVNEETPLFGS